MSISWPDPRTVSRCPHKGETVTVKIVDVHDGDTCLALVPFATDFLKLSIRIDGIDTPETLCKSKSRMAPKELELALLEEKCGARVREVAKELLLGRELKCCFRKWGKYGGRAIGELWLEDGATTLAEHLIARGMAKPYDGRKKAPWTYEELERILS